MCFQKGDPMPNLPDQSHPFGLSPELTGFHIMKLVITVGGAVILLVILGILLYQIINRIKNSKAPLETISARIVAKDLQYYNRSSYAPLGYIVFEKATGERIRLTLSRKDYDSLAIGDRGMLSYKRKQFVSFVRSGSDF